MIIKICVSNSDSFNIPEHIECCATTSLYPLIRGISGYDKYLATIGIRRPIPNAFCEMRSIGGVW